MIFDLLDVLSILDFPCGLIVYDWVLFKIYLKLVLWHSIPRINIKLIVKLFLLTFQLLDITVSSKWYSGSRAGIGICLVKLELYIFVHMVN